MKGLNEAARKDKDWGKNTDMDAFEKVEQPQKAPDGFGQFLEDAQKKLQPSWKKELLRHDAFHTGNCYCEVDSRCHYEDRLIAFIESEKQKAVENLIAKVEDIIAEFGDQGMECVARILDEQFHGGRDVNY